MRAVNFFPLLLLLAAGAASGGELYKWTLPDGTTQYGQYPPPGVQAERLKAAPAPTQATPSKSPQERLEDLNKLKAEQDKQKAEAAQKAQQAEIRKSNCANARKNLEQLNYGGNRRVKLPDGSYQRLDEPTRQQMLEKNRKAVKEYCD